jgi:PAS domain S-box-containing protein
MTEQLGAESPEVEQALTGGDPQRVGWFRFYFEDQRWEWSEQVQRIHGYEPGTVNPTTELVLSHKHPDDRHQVAATIDDIVHTHKAFSTRHRIIDTGGKVRHVVVVGDQLYDDSGLVIGTHGFYVDITPSERASEDIITERVAEITENRAGIEQAKGMLMLVYDIGDQAAFSLLKWLSQENNVKLRLIAEQIVSDFRAAASENAASRATLDQLLLTAHLRVAQPTPPVPAAH